MIETAIFWFGRVTPAENYADVRTAYNDDELYLRVVIFDRRIWYDTTPSPDELTAWDAITLFLDLAPFSVFLIFIIFHPHIFCILFY